MARVTVEDCVEKIPTRFELVLIAAQRARNISAGAALTVARDNDKNPVVSLREIAEETVSFAELEDSLIKGMQKHVEIDEPEEDNVDMLALQQEMSGMVQPQQSSSDLSDPLDMDDDVAEMDETGDIMLSAEEGESDGDAVAAEPVDEDTTGTP